MSDNNNKISHLGLSIDDYSKDVFVDGEPVKLQKMQFLVLYYLMSHKGKVVSHNEFRENVWRKNVTNRCIVVTMSKLKSAIRPYNKNIKTYSGFGYKFE